MFYQLMSARYANRRTFSPENEGGSGAAGAGDAAAGDDAAAATAAAAAPAGDAGNDAGKSKEAPAVTTEAPKTDDEKAALLREVMEKKGKLKEAEEKLKGFEGVDLAKYRELVAKEQDAERKAAEAAGDFERVKQMMAEAHQTEKAGLETTLTDLQAQLAERDNIINELTIGNDFGNSPFIQRELILSPAKTRALYGAHFEVEDGKTVGYDKPRGAPGRTKLVDGSGNPLTFNNALSKIVAADPDKKSVLRAQVTPGAGSGTTTSTGAKPATDSQLFGAARIRASLDGKK